MKRYEVILGRDDGYASARVEAREDGQWVRWEDVLPYIRRVAHVRDDTYICTDCGCELLELENKEFTKEPT